MSNNLFDDADEQEGKKSTPWPSFVPIESNFIMFMPLWSLLSFQLSSPCSSNRRKLRSRLRTHTPPQLKQKHMKRHLQFKKKIHMLLPLPSKR